MGTNYYIQQRTSDEDKEVLNRLSAILPRVHMGKKSMGWSFSFHCPMVWDLEKLGITTALDSYAAWKKLLWQDSKYEIIDEYGQYITAKELFEIIDNSKNDQNHTLYCRKSTREFDREHAAKDCFLDPEGHSFCTSEFS